MLALSAFNSGLATALGQGTEFSYQGLLQNGGAPVDGNHDFQLKLYLDPYGNTQAGSTFITNTVFVSNDLFMLTLDFGAGVFNGGNFWMQIGVRSNTAPNYAELTPLQQMTPTPYAIMMARN